MGSGHHHQHRKGVSRIHCPPGRPRPHDWGRRPVWRTGAAAVAGGAPEGAQSFGLAAIYAGEVKLCAAALPCPDRAAATVRAAFASTAPPSAMAGRRGVLSGTAERAQHLVERTRLRSSVFLFPPFFPYGKNSASFLQLRDCLLARIRGGERGEGGDEKKSPKLNRFHCTFFLPLQIVQKCGTGRNFSPVDHLPSPALHLHCK